MNIKQELKQIRYETKKNRNARSLMLAVILITVLTVFSAAVLSSDSQTASAAGTADTSWYHGTGMYEIGTADELAGLASIVNDGNDLDGSKIALTADIDLSSYNSGDGWTPIGNDSYQFKGTFDGNFHVIKNLTINTSAVYVGLFGYIGSGGTVKNLGIVGGSVVANDYAAVGSIAGENDGSITNCYNSLCSITNSGNFGVTGGVVGFNSGGEVSNCYNTGPVTDNGSNNLVGGTVGFNSGGEVSNCYNTGSVTASGDSSSTGGVVGFNNSGGVVSNCYNTGSVTGGTYVGGVVGWSYNGTVTNCYYNRENCSGLSDIGFNDGSGSATGQTTAQMTNTDTDTSDFENFMDGLGGAFEKVDYSDTSKNGCAKSFYLELAVFADAKLPDDSPDTFTRAMSEVSVIATRDCTLGPNEEYFTLGDGSQDYPYQIWTAQQLNHVREHLGSGVYFKLMCDIDVTGWNVVATNTDDPQTDGNGWVPIGNDSDPFNGTFDGNGFAIENLTFSRTLRVGLFGYIGSDGTVENLGIIGGSAGGYDQSAIGSVAGMNDGMVQYCYNTSQVSSIGAGSIVGGVVGGNGGTVQYCYNIGSVGGVDHSVVGGVTGFNHSGTVQYCYNTGPVSGGGCSAAGGVIGENFIEGMVQYCYNTGPVSGGDGDSEGLFSAAGGVIGENDMSGTVQYCYSTGSVTNAGENSYVGGVAGENIDGTVQCCYFNSENYSGGGIGKDDSGTGDTVGLTTAQMVHSDVLGGKMSALSGAFHKRDADAQYSYYPELEVFYTGTEQQQIDSKNSAAVEWNAPPAPSVKEYYITATATGGAIVSPDGKVAVQRGQSKTFAFFASSGYYVSSVIIDGKPLSQDLIDKGTYTFSSLNSNHTIDVFGTPGGKMPDMILSINITGSGKAEYSFDGGSTFATYSSAVIIPPSSDLVVRAVPDDGSSFSKWQTPSGIEKTEEISLGSADSSVHLDLFFTGNGGNHISTLRAVAIAGAVFIIVAGFALYRVFRKKV